MSKIAFFDSKPYDIRSFSSARLSCDCEFHFYEDRLTPETAALCRGMDAVCIFVNDQLNRKTIDEILKTDVKLIALRCAGFNNIDLAYLNGRLPVVRVPAYSPHAVAEHTLALIMTLNRKTHKAYMRTREGNFSIKGLTGFDLYQKTAGIIGAGKIGRTMIGILKGLGMKILAHDPFLNDSDAEKLGCSAVSPEVIYKQSDLISLHCPLTPENVHLISENSIRMMKKGVMIINTSRGGLIDSKALVDGLRSGHIGAAGLDVYEEEEEYFFEDHSESNVTDDVLARLLSFNNVLITSHQAFLTSEALSGIAETTLENIRSFFNEGMLKNEVRAD